MSLLLWLRHRLFGLLSRKTARVALDLGSQNTRIIINGRVVFAQPTCVVVHKNSGALVEIGQRAWAVWHKTPRQFETFFMIENGSVQHPDLLRQFLQLAWQEARTAYNLAEWVPTKVAVSIAAGLSPVDINVLRNAVQNSIGGWVTFLPKTTAYAELPPHAGVYLAVGHQITEMGMVLDKKPIWSKTLTWGGTQLIQAIRQHILDAYQVQVSWLVAEKVCWQLARAPRKNSRDQEKKLVVRGKHFAKGGPVSITVSENDCLQAIEPVLLELITELQQIKQEVSVDLADHMTQQKWTLLGGTAQLTGLAEYIAEQVRVSVALIPEPAEAEVKGLSHVAVLA